MANNRMYLVCTHCAPKHEDGWDTDAHFYLAKYYPSTGWYTWAHPADRMADKLNEWFERHRHADGEVISDGFKACWDNLFEPGRRFGTMDGNEHIRLKFEIEPEEACQSTSTSA